MNIKWYKSSPNIHKYSKNIFNLLQVNKNKHKVLNSFRNFSIQFICEMICNENKIYSVFLSLLKDYKIYFKIQCCFRQSLQTKNELGYSPSAVLMLLMESVLVNKYLECFGSSNT